MTCIHAILFKIWSKITRLWNMGHRQILVMVSMIASHQSLLFIHETHFQKWSKITGLWNIDHCHLYLLRGQSLCHTDSLSESMMLIHQDIGQNHWTMKYRSALPIFIMMVRGCVTLTQSMMFIHPIVFKI